MNCTLRKLTLLKLTLDAKERIYIETGQNAHDNDLVLKSNVNILLEKINQLKLE